MNPAIIGALISAATSAATTAAQETMRALNADKSKNPIACVFVNNTPYEWKMVTPYGQPFHGQRLVAPTAKVVSLIEGAEKTGENKWIESNYATWGLKSTGAGTDCVFVYRCEEIDLYVAFYAENHATPPWAGVSLSSGDWWRFRGDVDPKPGKRPTKDDDPKGKWIRRHIRFPKHYHKHHTDPGESCAYSRGAATVVSPDHLIELTCQAAIEETRFEMYFNGEWDSFNPERLLVASGSRNS